MLNSGGMPPLTAGKLPVDNSAVTQPVSGSVSVLTPNSSRTDTFTGAASGISISALTSPFSSFAVQVKGTGGVASVWDIRLEGSLDGTNFSQIVQHTNTTGDGAVVWTGSSKMPAFYFRSRCASITLGLATNVIVTILGVQ